jgi:hypothetical protein
MRNSDWSTSSSKKLSASLRANAVASDSAIKFRAIQRTAVDSAIGNSQGPVDGNVLRERGAQHASGNCAADAPHAIGALVTENLCVIGVIAR